MEINKLKPRKALNKAFLKVKPNRTQIEGFKINLIQLLDRTNESESEEFHKNLVSDFLKKTYYEPNHFINTKGRNDLVIHNGDKAKSSVGVIIEAKKPTNKSEMVSTDKLNVKAFQELVLYYLRERITQNNLETKHLIITNIHEWFIFDATTFDRLFAQNNKLVKQFQDFEAGRLSDSKTDFFYKQIAEPFIADIKSEIAFTYFNLQEYQKPLRNKDKTDDNKLIALFKLLSPEHLLKLPFSNDSNSLDKRFYSELLHIIGLTETKAGSKKLIERNKSGERHTGTLLEDAIIQLDSLDKLNQLDKPNQFGNTQQERLFNVALELSITWINRILFLKLLEAQLITYHKGDRSYAFLNLDKIKNYDDLNSLFFQVLARKQEDRNEDVIRVFEKVPYLNSSLFEPTDIEQHTLFISNLRDEKMIPIISSTVLKDQNGKKRTGELSTLEYLFEFLNAYDFSSEGSEDIQEENKSLINASVLGLIFEKINGYKDGSFFTPGFITMYMCRETIRKAVVQKFNETKNWNCENLEDLYDKIEDREEANAIINSLKICDPAVGSGHFLVSALNEMIAVKNDLKILQDRDGKRLKEYQVEVVNDELIITDEEGELFEYNPKSQESQRIQETLFHEKQTIIENCLFGVDINPNSVKICRLRLWIELLKNAYYLPSREKGEVSMELETLPNIDINIKCGNSLVSRFAIDADLKQALKKSKFSIESYRAAVDTYRNAENKEQKREMERLIDTIKSDFRSEIQTPFLQKLSQARGKAELLANRITNFKTFGQKVDKKLKTDYEKAVKKLQALEKEKEEIQANKIFENAFEWRFEFPEVLNDEGDFIGFDVVIGNPPYVPSRELNSGEIHYLSNAYATSEYQINTYSLFCELGLNVLRRNALLNYIIPNYWLSTNFDQNLRKLLFIENHVIELLNVFSVFETAVVDTLLLTAKNSNEKHNNITRVLSINPKSKSILERLEQVDSREWYFKMEKEVTIDNYNSIGFTKRFEIHGDCILSELLEAKFGIKVYQVGKGKPKQTSEMISSDIYQSTHKLDDSYLPVLRARDVSRYQVHRPKLFVKYGEHLAEPRKINMFQGPRILVQRIVGKTHLNCAYTEESLLCNSDVISLFPKKELSPEVVKGITAILNSSLCLQYLKSNNINLNRAAYPKINTNSLNDFPIKFSNSLYFDLCDQVDQVMLKKDENALSEIKKHEDKIDQLVYQLYGLTEEEIKIVEGA